MQRVPPRPPDDPNATPPGRKPEDPLSDPEALLDEELDESFPASDPRPWTHRDD